jgi:hypothetical protein
MSTDESPLSPLQKEHDQASRVYQLLSELSPLVDAVLPIINGLDAPPIANNIKRRIEDINDKINAKRACLGEEEKEEREVESLVDFHPSTDADTASPEPKILEAKVRPLIIAHIVVQLTIFIL